MPLISVNLRDPGGLASHMNYISKHVGKSLKERTHSDLVFVCSSGSLSSHQSIIEPLSPLLSTMFQQHNCCNCSGSYCGRREAIQIHLPDIKKETMRCVLDVIYTGKAYLTKACVEDIESLLKLLDVKLPGEFKHEECAPIQNEVITVFDTPGSSLSSYKKRKLSTSFNQIHMLGENAPPAKVPQIETKNESPEYLLIEMAKKLMPFEENKSLDCIVPGCTEKVSHHNMTSHFQKHFKDHESKQPEQKKDEIIMFKCNQCPKEFKFRRALDQHKKNHHTTTDLPKKKIVNTITKDFTLPMKDAPNENKSKFVCQYCKKDTKSEWHLTPRRHKCPLADMIEASKFAKIDDVHSTVSSEGVICKRCGKVLESSWHSSPSRHNCKAKHENIEPSEKAQEKLKCDQCGTCFKSHWHSGRHNCGKSKDSTIAPEVLVYNCKICMKGLENISNLSTHYTKEHYWAKLAEEVNKRTETWVNRCSICLIEFFTNDELIYHMGNIHRKFNKYLQEDGHEALQIIGKVKLDHFKCGIELCQKEKDNMSQLRMHLCTSHFSRSLHREFPEGGFSPCLSSCQQNHPNEAKRQYHIGCYHNEVFKFAAFHFKNVENEPILSTMYDLGELRKGVKFQEENQTENRGRKKAIEKGNTTPGSNNYKCGKCKKGYRTRTRLKYHIAFYHYKDKLMKTYSGTRCGICEREVESNKILLRHVAFKHDSVIAYLLGKDGLTLPRKLDKNVKNIAKTEPQDPNIVKMEPQDEQNEEENMSGIPEEPSTTVKTETVDQIDPPQRKRVPEAFVNKQCQICLKEFHNSGNLRIHYANIHYLKKILNAESDSLTSCSICSSAIESVKGSQKDGMVNHISFAHEDVLLKYMEEDNLWIGNSKIYSLGENGYRVKKMKIDIKSTEELKQKAQIVKAKNLKRENLKKKKMLKDSFQISTSKISPIQPAEPKLPLEELMKCFLCKKDFNGSGLNSLLSHFSEDHYRLELEHNYITRPGMTWMVDKRCPQCLKIVETKQQLIYHIGVEHREVEKFLPEKYKLPSIIEKDLSFPCPLKNCSSDKETKKALLVHLLIVHYQKDMEREFGQMFKKEGKKKCPKCNMALLDNYLGYMKHIAVEHAFVMNFVERDTNRDITENGKTEEILNRSENGKTEEVLNTSENGKKEQILNTEEGEMGEKDFQVPKKEENGQDLLRVLNNSVRIEDKNKKIETGASEENSSETALNPFFNESESKKEVPNKETEEVMPNLLQFEPCVASGQSTPTKENNKGFSRKSEIVLVNETQSRSASPDSSSESNAKDKQMFVGFDLRAILDSDSEAE